MNTRTYALIGSGAAAVALVAAIIVSLQGFDAEKIACSDIGNTRTRLQALYASGVDASVQIFAGEKEAIDGRLSACISAKPEDPCADAQKARDAAVAQFNDIASPAESAPYAAFQTYFQKRDEAYAAYKKSKDSLDQCRAANPPKAAVPYEQSDTKACFDAYDAAVAVARETFSHDTTTMRTALTAALAALDAREKACNPPKGKEQFTDPPRAQGASDDAAPVDLMRCALLNPDLDTDLFVLRKRAAAIPLEIEAIEKSVANIQKRMSPLRVDLAAVDTYIPPESTRTQFEGALNALRAERKVAIESSLSFYQNMLARRQAEKAALEQELRNVQAQIASRLAEIDRENAARRAQYPTALHQSKPDKCAYYHCHGMLCGLPDPAPHECGQGTTVQADTDCSQFIRAYLHAAGAN